MLFTDECKVIIDSMTKEEARVFILFLRTEITRHELDIDNARDLVYEVAMKFKLGDMVE